LLIRRLPPLVALALALCVAPLAQAGDGIAPSKDPKRVANGLAMTPPMGWNGWNAFDCGMTEKNVRDAADALVSSGMRDAGYRYVVIDDCWQGPRDADGFITADATKFPSGIEALADYVHRKGLKFGIYSDAGTMTCAERPGSQGHEYQDALVYARWGVDFLKYDWCYTGTRNAEEAYALMSDALRASERDIVFSMCEWGRSRPYGWASRIANLWRTTNDIANRWSSVIEIVDQNASLYSDAGPGHWNDPDMLEVGNGSAMTDAEQRTHFSLWALMAAPLMAGNDLTRMDAKTRTILTNREVIAVDQDAAGIQGRRVRVDGERETWAKPLSDGSHAVILFNRGADAAEMTVDWTDFGYPAGLSAKVRDLWAHKDLGKSKGGFTATVEAHGVVMLRIEA
jgi:alpha-galactosidase